MLIRTPQGRATPIDIDTDLPRFENKIALVLHQAAIDVTTKK